MSETQELLNAEKTADRIFIVTPDMKFLGYSNKNGEQRKYFKDKWGKYHYEIYQGRLFK